MRYLCQFLIVSFLLASTLAGRFAFGRLILNGDRTIKLLSLEQGGSGSYCLWLNSSDAQALAGKSVDWQIKLRTPSKSLSLTSSHKTSVSIPFELLVQAKPGAPFQRIRENHTLIQGRNLSSHCEPERSSFVLQVQPLVETGLIPGGYYREILPLEITTSEGNRQSLDFELRLKVPERVSARVLDRIDLPRFDGVSPPSGEARVCLFRNGGGQYSVRLQGDGANGAFVLKRKVAADIHRELPFEVKWKGGSLPAVAMTPGENSQVTVVRPMAIVRADLMHWCM